MFVGVQMWIKPIHYTCLVFIGAAIFLCRSRERRHSSVVFISDLVLSFELWTGGSEHQEVVLTIVLCFLCILYPWDVAALSGLDFEVEKVNVAFQIRSIYRTRLWFNNGWSPCAGNKNTNHERKRISLPTKHLPPDSVHFWGGLLYDKLGVCSLIKGILNWKCRWWKKVPSQPYGTERSTGLVQWCSWTLPGGIPLA